MIRTAPELMVVPDIAKKAAALFHQIRPRTLVLAGGQTPIPVYCRLAEEPYPWHEVDIFFGDERCVPPDDPASNFRMANECMLSHINARVHLMTDCDAEAYEREIRDIQAFDLAFLGIGADGHTASLFPGHPRLEERERLVVRVDAPDYTRLTLTLPALSRARTVIFLVAGAQKRDAVRRVMAGEDVPAARVQAPRLVIVADPAAGGGLSP